MGRKKAARLEGLRHWMGPPGGDPGGSYKKRGEAPAVSRCPRLVVHPVKILVLGSRDEGGRSPDLPLSSFCHAGRWNRTMLRVETWTQVGRDQGGGVALSGAGRSIATSHWRW